MGDCDFAFTLLRTFQDVGGFQIRLDTDQCGVESHRFCEFPIEGPDGANRLVIVTGVAVVAVDLDWSDEPRVALGDVWIKTDYVVRPNDQYITDIIEGKTQLRQTTYVALASIGGDDFPDAVTLGIDFATADIDSARRLQLHVRVRASDPLYRVSYQTSFLIRKAQPQFDSPIFQLPPAPGLDSGRIRGF